MATWTKTLCFLFVLGAVAGAAEPSATPTYCRDIAPILFARCADCHREGAVAPFPLLTFSDASKRAKWISEVIDSGLMPPWRAEPEFGHFVGERRVTPKERELLKAWAAAGAPEGDPKELPPIPKFPTGWMLGTPDLVLSMEEAFTIPAGGPDIFRNFAIRLSNTVTLNVKAIEFRPGNPVVVHHALTLCDPSGGAIERDRKDPAPGYPSTATGSEELVHGAGLVDVWAPGVTPSPFPKGVAMPIKPGSAMILNLHYHPSGKAESDKSMIGIYLAKEPIQRQVHLESPFIIGALNVDIPPGEKRHHIHGSFTLPVNVSIFGVFPHMHYLGQEMKMVATLPDKSTTPLIWIKRWDFNWQNKYVYATPLDLPKGTIVEIDAYYDNSSDNPLNPSKPPKRVLFGEETVDEMCIGIFQVAVENGRDAVVLRQALLRHSMQEALAGTMHIDVRRRILENLIQLGLKDSRDRKQSDNEK
jgi:mono/diheme cytochrome c family protein